MKLIKSKSQDGRPKYEMTTDEWLAIPGDVHIPFHDPVAVKSFMKATEGQSLLILGDLFDNYALSEFPKEQTKLAKYSLRKEIEVAAKYLKLFDEQYNHVVYLPGNHEARWNRLVAKNPALAGLEWWWPLRDIIPSRWEMLDVDSRIVLRRSGRRFVLEHGDKASRNSTYVSADKLTALYPQQVSIIGHNHRLAAHHRTNWINNKPVVTSAYSVGHLGDIAKLGYVSAPDWQQGGMVIQPCGSTQLMHIKGERVVWL